MTFLAAVLLLGLPLVGVLLSGREVSAYVEFPPLTQYVEHAPFSWPMFIGLAVFITAVVLPFVVRVLSRQGAAPRAHPPMASFPWWGWVGVGISLGTWVLAWTRFPWFARWQVFTFSPLWFGYILAVNGLTFRRTGRCLLTERPAYLLRLFFFSALFWWFFEYLNRFVQNWHYLGTGKLTPLKYTIFATLPFSTVLPAVLGTEEWLASHPGCAAGLDRFVRLDIRRPRRAALAGLLVACFTLAGIGIWPDWLFPFLWVSPLVILTAGQVLLGRPSMFAPLRDGDWRRVFRLALAALICGFFWELWNYGSLARWVYTVPFVGRFKLFEMPILGFAGYLPFGLECAVIAE